MYLETVTGNNWLASKAKTLPTARMNALEMHWRWSTASTACTEATVSPKEIANQTTSLLSDKGIPQHLFAEKVLNRSQGSFSDYLSKAPPRCLKRIARERGTAAGVDGDEDK